MTTKQKTILVGGGIVFALPIFGLLFPVVQGAYPVSKSQRTQLNMQSLLTASAAYRVGSGGWPPGDLAQMTRTLCGDNPQQLTFLQPDRRFTNSRGEPTDAWGTTLRLSFAGERARVESAGKDKIFGTPDDMTLTKP